MTPFPYWDIPFANQLVPRLRAFNADLELLDNVLEKLIKEALSTQNEADEETLQNRDYDQIGKCMSVECMSV